MSLCVAFFTDRAMLPGLHGALASLAAHAGSGAHPEPLRLVVFCDGVTRAEQRRLVATHDRHAVASGIETRDFSPRPFAPGANGLHGNYTAYGRMFLPHLLPDVERCIYLDSDLLITCDVRGILDHLPHDKVLAAYARSPRATSLDAELFEAAGLDMSGLAFNSGVLGMNLARWRALDMDARCRGVAGAHAGMFRSADQALLNVACHDEFAPLPRRFNNDVYCDSEAADVPAECVLHFVGSPKPWDPAGPWLHDLWPLWRGWARRTCLPRAWALRYSSPRRAFRTSASALRWWLKRRASRRAAARDLPGR